MDPIAAIFRAAHRQLRPRTEVPPIHIEFFKFTGINHTARLRDGSLKIRISDILADAPHEVLASLAFILLSKLYRRPIDNAYHRVYRGFVMSDEIRFRTREALAQRSRQVRTHGPGAHRDLGDRFEALNRLYFDGSLERPRLRWSPRRSTRTLGHWSEVHRTITISRFFDSESVPEFVLDYVLYHEMLHMVYPTRVEDCRNVIHPPELRRAERRYGLYREARLWLRTHVR